MNTSNILKTLLIIVFSGILYMIWQLNKSIKEINKNLSEVNDKIPHMTVYSVGELDEINRLRNQELLDGTPEGQGEGARSYNLQSVFKIEGDVDADITRVDGKFVNGSLPVERE
jgi:hypothetical protein